MAMTLRPTDGLVSRLLQQQTRSQPASSNAASLSAKKTDQINISSQAREQHEQSYQNKQSATIPQTDLEAHLLRLYAHHNTSER